jgi:hypothetical protein
LKSKVSSPWDVIWPAFKNPHGVEEGSQFDVGLTYDATVFGSNSPLTAIAAVLMTSGPASTRLTSLAAQGEAPLEKMVVLGWIFVVLPA